MDQAAPRLQLLLSESILTGSHTLTDSQTIYLGDNASQINPTNTPTPTILTVIATYQWQRRDFGSLTWYNIAGAAAQLPSYSPPAGAVTQTTFYKRIITFTQSSTACSTQTALFESSVHTVNIGIHPGGNHCVYNINLYRRLG